MGSTGQKEEIHRHSGWLIPGIFFFAVLLLSGLHGAMSKWRREFMEDRNTRPQRFYRIVVFD